MFAVGGHLGCVFLLQRIVRFLFVGVELVGLEVDDVGGCRFALGGDGDYESVDGAGKPFVFIRDGFDGLFVVYLLAGFAGEERGDFRLLQGVGNDLLSRCLWR